MSANTTPIFTLTPHILRQRVAVANTARDGSGTVNALLLDDNATAFTGSISGTRIDKVTVTSAQASATANSAMVARLFLSDSAGANYRLVCEVAVTAVTASNTAIGATFPFVLPNGFLIVPSGCKLGVTQSIYAGVQDQMDYIANVADYQ